MEYVTLSNGVKVPKNGYGVYQIAKEDCERCVIDAIKVGYRLIDTAQSYFNEEEVGNAIQKVIKEGVVKREDLYEEGKIRAIGVSNFYPDRLTDMCLFERKVVPHINQVETNVFNGQYEAQENMEKYNVQIEA